MKMQNDRQIEIAAKMIIMTIYIIGWMATWPAILASTQGRHNKQFNDDWFRRDLAFSMGMALIPPVWIMTPFITGFYEQGFQFKRRAS